MQVDRSLVGPLDPLAQRRRRRSTTWRPPPAAHRGSPSASPAAARADARGVAVARPRAPVALLRPADTQHLPLRAREEARPSPDEAPSPTARSASAAPRSRRLRRCAPRMSGWSSGVTAAPCRRARSVPTHWRRVSGARARAPTGTRGRRGPSSDVLQLLGRDAAVVRRAAEGDGGAPSSHSSAGCMVRSASSRARTGGVAEVGDDVVGARGAVSGSASPPRSRGSTKNSSCLATAPRRARCPPPRRRHSRPRAARRDAPRSTVSPDDDDDVARAAAPPPPPQPPAAAPDAPPPSPPPSRPANPTVSHRDGGTSRAKSRAPSPRPPPRRAAATPAGIRPRRGARGASARPPAEECGHLGAGSVAGAESSSGRRRSRRGASPRLPPRTRAAR